MNTDTKYNGWTNYETWNVALWMGEGGDYYSEQAQEIYDNATIEYEWQTKDDAATSGFAEYLKDSHDELLEMSGFQPTGVFADLLGAALSEVNWYEIATHYIDEVEKEADNDS